MWSHVNLNKIGSRSQISSMQIKFHRRYYVDFLIYEYLSHGQQSTLAIDATKITLSVFSTFKSIYLKYLKYLQSGRKFELSISNDMWSYFFRYKAGSFIFIFSVTFLVYIFFSYVSIVHLLWRREGFGIYCKFIPDWIKSTWAIILFYAQYRTGIQNQFRNTIWIIISKYHILIRQKASLYLDSFISNASWIFSPIVFPRS